MTDNYDDILEEEDDLQKSRQACVVPEYAKFDTTIGDDFGPCCKEVETKGVTFAVSDVGKKVTEAICKILRNEGFSADWHSVKNSVSLKTLDSGDRLSLLRRRWRELVRDFSSGNLRIR